MTQPTPSELLQQYSCSLIPIRVDKKPDSSLLLPGGQWKPFQERLPTTAELNSWSHAAGLAIVTGKISRRITFDFDGQTGVELARRWAIRPHRRTGSGGFHLDVVHPGWSVPTLNGKAKRELGMRWPGLDIKGDGGYVIALGRNENGPYEWLRSPEPDPPNVLPAEIWKFLQEHSQSANTSAGGDLHRQNGTGAVPAPTNNLCGDRVDSERLIRRALDEARSVGRNNAGFDLACQLRDNSYSENETLEFMRTYRARVPSVNTKGQNEPYTDTEVTATVREVFSKPARNAWSPPCYTQRRTYRNGFASDHYTDSDVETREATIDLLAFSLTDCGNAERLKAAAGEDVCYCHGFKKWLIWDETRWKIDLVDEILRRAKATILQFLSQAIQAKNEQAEKFARQSLDARRLHAMVSLAECELPITPEQLDTNPYLLNFRNATVDLRTGDCRPHSQEDFITKVIEHDYNAEATCPLFEATLLRLMGGGPDASEEEVNRAEALVNHLHKAIGYSATGITSEKVVFVVHGSGANGKTTILVIIFQCLGEYSGVVLVESIMSRQENNNASADLADLRGARFVMTSETEEGQRLAEGKLKRITQGVAGGKIKACRKYENPIEFTETHKLWMDCNHKPVVRGTNAGIWNRIHLIPFNVTISPDEIDRELPTKLMAEAPGILAWIVAGAVRWFQEGLGRPPEVAEALREYREEMDQVGRFVDECCVVGSFATAKAREVYMCYRKWAEDAGESFVTETAFGRKLAERAFVKKHTEHGARYEGIGLRS